VIRAPRAAAAGAFAVLLALGSAALAQPAADGAAPGPSDGRAVAVTVVGGPDDLDRVRALLDRRLAARGPVTWSRAAALEPADVLGAPPGGPLRCWIDLRDRRRARLTFAARSRERFLVRDVELSGNFDELDRAALAEVVELSIEALQEDDRAGLPRGEAEALLARRAPPSPTTATVTAPARSPLVDAPALVREGRRFVFGGFYAAQAQTAGTPIAHGPGVSAAVSTELDRDRYGLGGRMFVAAWLTGQLRLPEDVRGTDVAVRIATVAARAGVDAGRRDLRLRVGAGLDIVHVASAPLDPAITVGPDHWSSSLVLTAAVRFVVYRGIALRLWGSVFADVLPTAVDYGVDAAGRFAPVFSPWRARPGLALDITFR
jgi:hypothetical protein